MNTDTLDKMRRMRFWGMHRAFALLGYASCL